MVFSGISGCVLNVRLAGLIVFGGLCCLVLAAASPRCAAFSGLGLRLRAVVLMFFGRLTFLEDQKDGDLALQ